MARIKSFGLKQGERIGNYRVFEMIGRGWEGEVYKVAEVPTDAIRALKMFRSDELDSTRHLIHYAWYFEQLRVTGHFPIYYHYGQWFLDDDNGCWYLIFEYVSGRKLTEMQPTPEVFLSVVSAVANVHSLGFAVGDMRSPGNVIVTETGRVVFVDCDPGKPDRPNQDYRRDCKEELPELAKRCFKGSLPDAVSALFSALGKVRRFTQSSLATAISSVKG